MDTCSLASVLKFIFGEDFQKLKLRGVGHLCFNWMVELQILTIKVHINESSMANILSFAEVANVTGANINIDTFKGKVINVHIKDRKTIHFKSCA